MKREYYESKECWINQRILEMEEKSGLNKIIFKQEDLPEYDMDGSRFVPEYPPEVEIMQYDTYLWSLSKRFFHFQESKMWIFM